MLENGTYYSREEQGRWICTNCGYIHDGKQAEETADMLEEPINLMRQIYEMLDQYTPDYDVEKIYKGLLEKAILPV
jgi:Zn-finger protein